MKEIKNCTNCSHGYLRTSSGTHAVEVSWFCSAKRRKITEYTRDLKNGDPKNIPIWCPIIAKEDD